MTYHDALAYLERFVNFERQHQAHAMREVPLERMRQLCERLGSPQRRFRSILVTGTNGKGSICAMLYAMLRQSRLRVGLYTSPHLEQVRERIRVGPSDALANDAGEGADWIPEAEFASIVEQLHPILEELRRGPAEQLPTYFELLTAIAFVYFCHYRVELAVLEVGLGGRLDATNVVEQTVSLIGPIALDHTDVLGADAIAIAKEKAGIIKPGQLVISATQEEAVATVLRQVCQRQEVPCYTVGEDCSASVHHQDLHGLQVTVKGLRGFYDSLDLPLVGRHQAQNAALAVAGLEALSPTGIPHYVVRQGLPQVAWPGRFEVVHERPLVIMDGAHNPHAAIAAVQTLLDVCPGQAVHLLIGMSADKAVEGMGRVLGKIAVSATCTQSRHPRALEATQLANRLFRFCPDVHVMSDPVDAYTYLLNAVSARDVIFVTGSLFLIGELRAALRHAHLRLRSAMPLGTIIDDSPKEDHDADGDGGMAGGPDLPAESATG